MNMLDRTDGYSVSMLENDIKGWLVFAVWDDSWGRILVQVVELGRNGELNSSTIRHAHHIETELANPFIRSRRTGLWKGRLGAPYKRLCRHPDIPLNFACTLYWIEKSPLKKQTCEWYTFKLLLALGFHPARASKLVGFGFYCMNVSFIPISFL